MTKEELLDLMEPYKGREYRRPDDFKARMFVEGKINRALEEGEITEEWVESIQQDYAPIFCCIPNVLMRYRMRKNGAKFIL